MPSGPNWTPKPANTGGAKLDCALSIPTTSQDEGLHLSYPKGFGVFASYEKQRMVRYT